MLNLLHKSLAAWTEKARAALEEQGHLKVPTIHIILAPPFTSEISKIVDAVIEKAARLNARFANIDSKSIRRKLLSSHIQVFPGRPFFRIKIFFWQVIRYAIFNEWMN